MKLACIAATASCLVPLTPAIAETLTPDFVKTTPSGHQKVWQAALDLRDLPSGSRPSSIAAEVDAGGLLQHGEETFKASISINGIVVAQRAIAPGQKAKLQAELQDRLLSTRNRISVALTALGQACPTDACDVRNGELRGPIQYSINTATPEPISFAEHITRFRSGVSLHVADPRDSQLGKLAIQSVAPQAPIRMEGPAEIIVSRVPPSGLQAPLRLDTGPVDIKDREGHVLFDQARLEALTIVQLVRRGNRPVLWIRPGTEPVAQEPFELDYGNIALFGSRGREIAFSAKQDHDLTIAYAATAIREARTGLYWRLGVAGAWLVLTIGFVGVLRRMKPIAPAAA